MVATCTNPVVKFEAYSTGDIYLSSETVFIIEAEVQCKGTEVRKKQLFLLGNLVQLVGSLLHVLDSLQCHFKNLSMLGFPTVFHSGLMATMLCRK